MSWDVRRSLCILAIRLNYRSTKKNSLEYRNKLITDMVVRGPWLYILHVDLVADSESTYTTAMVLHISATCVLRGDKV